MPREVVIFAGALYDSPLWTNRQHIATRLAKRGWRVFYVEPRLFLPRMLFGKYPGTRGRLKWLVRLRIPWRVKPSLWIMSQFNIIPGSREMRWVSALNHLPNVVPLRLHLFLRGFCDPVVLIYDTEAAQYLHSFPRSRIVYDCVDDHRFQAGVDRNPARVEQEEEMIAERADAISVTTEPLLKRFQLLNQNVHLNPNAADISRFLGRGEAVSREGCDVFAGAEREPGDIVSIPHPRIGTVGTLDAYKIDVALLSEVARSHPEWHFVMVGPVEHVESRKCGVKKGADAIRLLNSLPNVYFLGAKSYDEIPVYVQAFDVAIIPYRESDYNRSSFPLKFWEFMASGKPVVASGLPSLLPYKHLGKLASSSEEFALGIQQALENPEKGRESRVKEAKKHDWVVRVNVIEQLLMH